MRGGLASGAAAGVAGAASQVALLATSAWLITRASLRPPVLLLAVAIGAVQAFALARGLARYAERLAVHDRSLALLGTLRVRLFDRLVRLVPGGLPGRTTATVLKALVTDTEAVTEAVARRTTAVVEAAGGALCGIGLLAALEPVAAVVLGGGIVAVGIVAVATGALARADADRAAEAAEAHVEAVLAALAAAPELVAYGRHDLVTAQLAHAAARAEAAEGRAARHSGTGRLAALAISGGTLLGILAVGWAAHRAGRLTGVDLAVAALAGLGALETLVGLPGVAAALAAGSTAAHRLAALAELPSPAPEPADPLPAPARPAGVALEKVVVARGGDVLLPGCSLAVPPGRRLGLAGPNGSGKTTAILTLLHFLEPTAGTARLGEVGVGRLVRADLGARVGWVPEDAHVFCGTLGANLRLADPKASTAACQEALRRVGLGPLLDDLPAGLDTPVGATGRPLSAGERQRLGLARALLAQRDVLLLDEPTAHLDPDGARRAAGELLAAAGDRAVLAVSHDPALLAACDDVVRLPPAPTAPGAPSPSG